MDDAAIDALIEQLERGEQPLSELALQLESAAKASKDAARAALVARELQGYGANATAEELAEAARGSDVAGRMKLSAIESRLATARANASAGEATGGAAAELAHIKAAAETQQFQELVAERRAFLLRIAHELRSETRQAWVCSIHGILTRGVWQKDLAPLLSERGLNPYLFDYRWYDPLRMLFAGSRDKKIDAFRDEYGVFRQIRKGVTPSIVAHSLGSYIVTRAIEKYGLEFDRVILCGSIVRKDYPWKAQVDAGRVRRVLHDYGRRDIWARLVVWFVEDAGQSGFSGFDDLADGAVVERRHSWYRHSDYFFATNFIERWIPFLRGTDPPPLPPEAPRRVNWRFRIVKYAVLTLLLAAIVLVVMTLRGT
jgi:pimeloyl-ACP methyl ester carboxylesterase